MFKKICFVLAVMVLLASVGVAYAAPPDQQQSQKGLMETAWEAGNFTTLVQALDTANLSDTLESEGPFTVFVPTDEAFAALPPGTLEDLFANVQALRDMLSYHVVEGKLATTDLMTMEALGTLQGAAVTINSTGSVITIGGANIVGEPVQAANGVIYAIDTVLMPPNSMMGTEAEPAMPEPSSTQSDSAAMAMNTGSCAEDYAVQADDSLSQIANKFLGNPQEFSDIVTATNDKAADNPTYTTIDNPNLIVVGQVLCIPATATTEMTAPSTGSGGVAPAESAAQNDETMPQDNQNQMAITIPDIPDGKGLVIFENFSSVDLVFDLSGPTPDSLVVPPGAKQNFVLDPGQYGYNGHQPGDEYSIAPGGFKLVDQQMIQVSCTNTPQCYVQTPQMAQ